MSVALARCGFMVEAVDHASGMVELTRLHAKEAGVNSRVHATVEDVHRLTFGNCSFDLVVALGVIAWLYDVRKALVEISRVLIPGGYAVLNMYSRNRAIACVDFPTALRGTVLNRLGKTGWHSSPRTAVARGHAHSIKEFNHYLYDADLVNVKDASVGFGPFRLFNRNVLSDKLGVMVHLKLQKRADDGCPMFRLSGSQYVVLARKEPAQPTRFFGGTLQEIRLQRRRLVRLGSRLTRHRPLSCVRCVGC